MASLVNIFRRKVSMLAVPVISGLMNEIAFHDWKFTTRSASACWREEGAVSGKVSHPANARRMTSDE